MNAQLQNIHAALKQLVLTYVEAQKIDTEASYNKAINMADTQMRVIANKRLPILVHDLMHELQVLDAIEFEVSEASVQYVIQVVASMVSFPQIWERHLDRYGKSAIAQAHIIRIFELCDAMHDNYMVLSGFEEPHPNPPREGGL